MSTAYVLWQRPVMARRTFAAAWADWFSQPGGVDEAEARKATTVVLVGAPDFFPSTPFAAGTLVWRIKPRPGDDPEELEPMFQAISEGHAEPKLETDPRAVEPRVAGEAVAAEAVAPEAGAEGRGESDAGETPVAAVADASSAVGAASAVAAGAVVGGDDAAGVEDGFRESRRANVEIRGTYEVGGLVTEAPAVAPMVPVDAGGAVQAESVVPVDAGADASMAVADAPVAPDYASAVLHDASAVPDYAVGTATDAPVGVTYAPAEEGLRRAVVDRATYDVQGIK